MKWAWSRWEIYSVFQYSNKRTDYLEYLFIDLRMILTRTLEEYDVRLWVEGVYLKLGLNGRLL
jgi:hypothetical protein